MSRRGRDAEPEVSAYREHAPPPALAPFVECFWTIRTGTAPPTRRVLPDGCADLLFDGRSGRALLVGAMTRAHEFAATAPLDLVAVRFHPGGAAPFVGDLAPFTDRREDLASLGPWARELAHVAADGAAAADDRLRAIAGALLRRAPVGRRDAIDAALAALRTAPEPFRVAEAAAAAAVSRQWFTRAVRERTGLGSKELVRILRLRRTLAALRRGVPAAHAASDGGYADQSHLCRDARALTGLTPGALAANARA